MAEIPATSMPTIARVVEIPFQPGDKVVVSFKSIPEGVDVIVPGRVGLATDDPATDANEMIESFELSLVTEGTMAGVGKGVNGRYPVELSASGAGAVVYNISLLSG